MHPADLARAVRRWCERWRWLVAAYRAHRRESVLFDVARNAPTWQSSYQNPALAAHAGRPLKNRRFCATTVEDRPWWMVELKDDFPIHTIRIHNRPGGSAPRAARLVVSVSADRERWQVVHAGLHYFGDEGAPGPLEIRLLGECAGRFVRLQLPHEGALCLRQVEILVERKRGRRPGPLRAFLNRIRAVRRAIAGKRQVPGWWRTWRNQVMAAQNCPTLVDVATRGVASQSSISEGRNTSGRTGSDLFLATECEASPWWMVDLGIAWPVHAIRLHNRAGRESRPASRIVVSISADGREWNEVLARMHFFGDADPPGPLEIRLRGGHLARFVRVQLPEAGVLSLRQVEVLVDSGLIDLHTTCKRYGLDYARMAPRYFGSASKRVYTLDGAPQRFDGTIEALHISRPIGRFGNHFRTLVLASCLARRLGVKRVYVPKLSQFDITGPLEADGISLLPERMLTEDRLGAVLSGPFFYEDAFGDVMERIDDREAKWALHNFVRPLFWRDAHTPPFAPEDTDLAIHIRSGDLFSRRRPYTGYVQPPLAYYQLIVRYAQQTLGTKRVILVYEDEGNPCIGALKRWLHDIGMPLLAQSASLEEDLSVLLHTRHCVFGQGSFGPAIVQLSNCMRTVFVFWTAPHITTIARRVGVRPILIHDAAGRYIKPGTWNNSPEQLQLMLDYPIEGIAVDETAATVPLSGPTPELLH
jgi:hypothetical protein